MVSGELYGYVSRHSLEGETILKTTLALLLSMIVLAANACATQVPAAPTPLPASATPLPVAQPTLTVEMQMPTSVPPTPANATQAQKTYTNSTFGLSFRYPSDWFGPDEYIADQTLRVAVGSDVVYPYGEQPEKPSQVVNSYLIVVQYTKNDQVKAWKDDYASLAKLKDGESLSGPRSQIIRVRQLELGNYKGYEYIATLSETAQTDHVYSRDVVLVDDQSDVLTISGNPNNVEIADGTQWRDAYGTIDETNEPIFQAIVDSMAIK